MACAWAFWCNELESTGDCDLVSWLLFFFSCTLTILKHKISWWMIREMLPGNPLVGPKHSSFVLKISFCFTAFDIFSWEWCFLSWPCLIESFVNQLCWALAIQSLLRAAKYMINCFIALGLYIYEVNIITYCNLFIF